MMLTDSLLEIPFFGRTNEINDGIRFLKTKSKEDQIRKQLLILGESGTGKSRFIKELIYKVNNENNINETTFIYIDAFDSINDELSENLFFEVLLFHVMNEKKYRKSDITKIDSTQSFKSYLKSSNIKGTIKNSIYSTLRNSLALIPNIGSEIKNILPSKLPTPNTTNHSRNYEIHLLFQNYVRFLAKKNGLIFILDNYQFINEKDQNLLKHIIKSLDDNIVFMQIIRTLPNDNVIQLMQKNKVFDDFGCIELSVLNINQVRSLLEESIRSKENEDIGVIANYCYEITKGNFKEIEQFIIEKNWKNNNYSEHYIDSPTIRNINTLSRIKKDILLLSSLFPTGIKMDYIKEIIDLDENVNENRNFILIKHLNSLIERKLVKLDHNNLVKPDHERILNSIDKVISDHDFLRLRIKIIEVFKTYADRSNNSSDFIFLVNNLIGLQKLIELKKDIKLIVKYIDLLNSESQYSKLVFLYEKIAFEENAYVTTVIDQLPLYTVTIFLNSFQRTSKFHLGINLLKSLKEYYSSDLYEARYLVQLYKYNEAITLLETNLNNIEYYSVYLNLLQHQRQDVKVRNHINALKTNYMEYENNENYIVILRNSGHLFNYETSSLNLRKCIKYFKSVNSHFGRATSLNNLGIVYLYNSDNETALKCFVEAKIIFEELYSNEVYQAIFNIGVYYLVRNEYGTALSYFNDAISTLPQLLGYDLCKFKNNKSICEFFNGELNLNQLVALFEDLQKQALDIPDPWAQFQLQYNLGSLIFLKDRDYGQKLKIKATNNYPGDPSIYGIRKVFIVDSVEIDLILSISPHWRY